MSGGLTLRLIGFVASVLSVPFISACTVERAPQLFPTNDAAQGTGVLQGQMVGHGTGYGTIQFTLLSGERLQGQYSIITGGAVGFGNIFATVYGTGNVATGNATATNYVVAGTGTGSASLYGDKGTSVQCEFINNNLTGHGYGACRSSAGAIYRMVY